MNRPRPLRLAALVPIACAAFLLFASTASAEVLIGESTTRYPTNPAPTPEATLVRASASYDTAGSLSFSFTTEAPPLEELSGKENKINIMAYFLAAKECTPGGNVAPVPPLGILVSSYASPAAIGGFEKPGGEEGFGTATKTVSGATTTLSYTDGRMAEAGFDCSLILLTEEEGNGGLSGMYVPLAPAPPPSPSTPAPPPSSAQPAPTAPAPPAAPAKLAIAQPKPVQAKAGKWKTVKVTVTNTGATASAQGSLKVKPAKGIKVKPEAQTLPALLPGASWTLTVKVQGTDKAKKKSTLSVTGTASGSTATTSLVVKTSS